MPDAPSLWRGGNQLFRYRQYIRIFACMYEAMAALAFPHDVAAGVRRVIHDPRGDVPSTVGYTSRLHRTALRIAELITRYVIV